MKKNDLNKWFGSPRTTLGALIAVAGIIVTFMADTNIGITLIGIAATWIGVNSKDAQ
jgi:drug/metabolite transporter (DMT)-like permease